MKKAAVTNIQKFSLQDGEGIRTTVFFKGCPLNCIWCHNPETWSSTPQLMYNTDICTLCKECFDSCPNNVIHAKVSKNSGEAVGAVHDYYKCQTCGSCAETCFSNAKEICGKEYSVLEIFEAIKRDVPFYEQSGGGATLSGGEVMAQDIEFLTELAQLCRDADISLNIDTCGYAPYEKFLKLLPYIDTFLYDLKIMDSVRHGQFTGRDNFLILENLKKLSNAGAKIHIRLPLIEGINCDEQNISALIEFLRGINIYKISLLPYHNIGEAKYERLGLPKSDIHFKAPSLETLTEIRDRFKNIGFDAACDGLD